VGVKNITPMKDAIEIKDICDEYCEDFVLHCESEFTVLLNSKFLEDLKKRLSCHGWVIRKTKKKYFL